MCEQLAWGVALFSVGILTVCVLVCSCVCELTLAAAGQQAYRLQKQGPAVHVSVSGFLLSLFVSVVFSSAASSLCSESCNHFFLSPSSTCCHARKLPLYRPRPNSAIRWVVTEKQSEEWIRNSLMIIELSMSDPWITVIQGLRSRSWLVTGEHTGRYYIATVN